MQTKTTHANSDSGNEENSVIKFLNAFGQLINSIGLYGCEHKIAQQDLARAYDSLSAALETRKSIAFVFKDDQFLVDDKPVDSDNSFVTLVRRKLQKLDISGFSLMHGISKDELFKTAKIIAEGKGTIIDGNTEHIQKETSRYERVGDSDIVINKKVAAGRAVKRTAKRAADGVYELAIDDAGGLNQPAAGIHQIMAFLKGGVGTLSNDTARAIQNSATDIDKLGQLIMESAAVRQRDLLISQGESLADIVIGCLRRTFDGLNRHPDKTKPPGSIKKTMLMLEKNILDRLRQTAGYDGNLEAAVSSAIDNMIANSLAPRDWQKLVVQSGVNMTPALSGKGETNTQTALNALNALLARLDHLMASDKLDLPDTKRTIDQVNQGVKSSAATAAGKIQSLESDIIKAYTGMDASAASWRRQVAISNARTMEIISEIVQELAQSLSAMNCAITMTLQERIGSLDPTQKSILKLAADSGENLDGLFQRLVTVTGLPKSLQPNKESVYQINIR